MKQFNFLIIMFIVFLLNINSAYSNGSFGISYSINMPIIPQKKTMSDRFAFYQFHREAMGIKDKYIDYIWDYLNKNIAENPGHTTYDEIKLAYIDILTITQKEPDYDYNRWFLGVLRSHYSDEYPRDSEKSLMLNVSFDVSRIIDEEFQSKMKSLAFIYPTCRITDKSKTMAFKLLDHIIDMESKYSNFLAGDFDYYDFGIDPIFRAAHKKKKMILEFSKYENCNKPIDNFWSPESRVIYGLDKIFRDLLGEAQYTITKAQTGIDESSWFSEERSSYKKMLARAQYLQKELTTLPELHTEYLPKFLKAYEEALIENKDQANIKSSYSEFYNKSIKFFSKISSKPKDERNIEHWRQSLESAALNVESYIKEIKTDLEKR